MAEPILEIKNLRTNFKTSRGLIRAVNQLNLIINRGETLALVGESGCGKSMTALSIMRLVPEPAGHIDGGEIIYTPKSGEAVNLLQISEKDMRRIRGNRIAMIFQEPMTSLNPVFTIGNQITEVYQVHLKLKRKEARERAIEMLKKVGIPVPEKRIDEYPHQLSGGMRQRVMIAMALAMSPDLLIADEPTTALDVTIQAQILELMKSLTAEYGMSLLLITHDLGIVAEQAQRVAVMYAGQVVEQASVEELFDAPKHPYTRGLLHSLPARHVKGERLNAIPGMVPDLATLPKGCAFQNRCEQVKEDCERNPPQLLGSIDGHRVRCFYPY